MEAFACATTRRSADLVYCHNAILASSSDGQRDSSFANVYGLRGHLPMQALVRSAWMRKAMLWSGG